MLITAQLPRLNSLAPPPIPPANNYRPMRSTANAWPNGRHVYRTLLMSDGSRGLPIVYSLGIHTRQTMIAINRRQCDGAPVRDQPSQRWFIGLTNVLAGPYVDVDWHTF